jgi:hypothetical protein
MLPASPIPESGICDPFPPAWLNWLEIPGSRISFYLMVFSKTKNWNKVGFFPRITDTSPAFAIFPSALFPDRVVWDGFFLYNMPPCPPFSLVYRASGMHVSLIGFLPV